MVPTRDRWFTPASAQSALRRLKPHVEEMRRMMHAMESGPRTRSVPESPVPRRYFALLMRFHVAARALTRAGVLIRDPLRGLLDFPARREGRIVYLCWRVGEPAIGHWHEVADGFAGRRPLDEDGPWERDRRG